MIQAIRPLEFVFWNDIVVIIDRGRTRASDYSGLEKLALDQASRYPFGIGVLTVIPPDAVPPSAEARNAISALLAHVGKGLRCLCWLVEGSGFQGAMVRAVLVGLKVFGRYPYATHVSTDLGEALTWMLEQLQGRGLARLGDVPAAERSIRQQRAKSTITTSPS
jgi:hypothetical protein